MNWKALKNFKCPNCGSQLTQQGITRMMVIDCQCGFKITKEKFDRIVGGMYKRVPPVSEEQKLSELNNLGREKMSEDFSDSYPES